MVGGVRPVGLVLLALAPAGEAVSDPLVAQFAPIARLMLDEYRANRASA